MFRIDSPDIFVMSFFYRLEIARTRWMDMMDVMSIGGFVFDGSQLYEVMSRVEFDGVPMPELRFRNPERLRVFSAGTFSCC